MVGSLGRLQIGAPAVMPRLDAIREFSKKKEDKAVSKKNVNKAGKGNAEPGSAVGEEYNDAPFKQRMKDAYDHLLQEFDALRIGRASPEQIQNVMVKAYGSQMPLNSLGQIYFKPPNSLVVNPYDANDITPIIQAIETCGLGLNPMRETDSAGNTYAVVPFPKPTREMRDLMIKKAKAKAEEVRTSIRHARKAWLDKIKQVIPAEDEAKRVRKSDCVVATTAPTATSTNGVCKQNTHCFRDYETFPTPTYSLIRLCKPQLTSISMM